MKSNAGGPGRIQQAGRFRDQISPWPEPHEIFLLEFRHRPLTGGLSRLSPCQSKLICCVVERLADPPIAHACTVAPGSILGIMAWPGRTPGRPPGLAFYDTATVSLLHRYVAPSPLGPLRAAAGGENGKCSSSSICCCHSSACLGCLSWDRRFCSPGSPVLTPIPPCARVICRSLGEVVGCCIISSAISSARRCAWPAAQGSGRECSAIAPVDIWDSACSVCERGSKLQNFHG